VEFLSRRWFCFSSLALHYSNGLSTPKPSLKIPREEGPIASEVAEAQAVKAKKSTLGKMMESSETLFTAR
jgi:hypothetical protein